MEPAFSLSSCLCEGRAEFGISHRGTGCSSVQLGAVPDCQAYPCLPWHLPAAASGCPHRGGGSTFPLMRCFPFHEGVNTWHRTLWVYGNWNISWVQNQVLLIAMSDSLTVRVPPLRFTVQQEFEMTLLKANCNNQMCSVVCFFHLLLWKLCFLLWLTVFVGINPCLWSKINFWTSAMLREYCNVRRQSWTNGILNVGVSDLNRSVIISCYFSSLHLDKYLKKL